MGEDFWPYGFEKNQHTLATFLRYHHKQGLSKRLLKPRQKTRLKIQFNRWNL